MPKEEVTSITYEISIGKIFRDALVFYRVIPAFVADRDVTFVTYQSRLHVCAIFCTDHILGVTDNLTVLLVLHTSAPFPAVLTEEHLVSLYCRSVVCSETLCAKVRSKR